MLLFMAAHITLSAPMMRYARRRYVCYDTLFRVTNAVAFDAAMPRLMLADDDDTSMRWRAIWLRYALRLLFYMIEERGEPLHAAIR